MSGSLFSTSQASAAAQQSVNSAIGSQAAASLSSTSTGSTASALDSLTSNFNDFLQLLLTQLQNQDPTAPMDSTQFTAELVEFAGVQQQVNTNTNLNTLIQLTQGEETLQGSAMVGKTVDLNSTSLPLQNSTGTIEYTAVAANEPVQITISNSSGQEVRTVHVTSSQQGTNSWTWNGQNDSGVQLPDGSYSVAVQGGIGTNVSAMPFTVQGTVTGVISNSGTIELQVGGLTTPLSSVASVTAN
jgi:flagellar basal-body rod modification protein FlgD